MAAADDEEEVVDEGLQQGMGKVTDVVAEKELDADKMANAMKEMEAATAAANAEKAEREAALKAIKVDKADVKVIMAEFELKEDPAKRVLQEAGGSLEKALADAVSA